MRRSIPIMAYFWIRLLISVNAKIALSLTIFFLLLTQANGGIIYNFVKAPDGPPPEPGDPPPVSSPFDGKVLAQLTLDVPATYLDLELLSFTQDGFDLLNNGDVIEDFIYGDFQKFITPLDPITREPIPGEIISVDPDNNPFPPFLASTTSFLESRAKKSNSPMTVNLTFNESGNSGIATLAFKGNELRPEISVSGYWDLASVPEPGTAIVWSCIAAIGIGGSVRRRRKTCP